MIMNQSHTVVRLRKGGAESKTKVGIDGCKENCPDTAEILRCMLSSQGKVISANCLLIYL